MFGHHDDTNYGIGWDGEEGRSDVKACAEIIPLLSVSIWDI